MVIKILKILIILLTLQISYNKYIILRKKTTIENYFSEFY